MVSLRDRCWVLLLFVKYINDLSHNLETNETMFADDTKIYGEIKNEDDNTKLQDDLNKLDEWSQKWLLKFHPDKCKVLNLSKNFKLKTELHLYSNDKHRNIIQLENISAEKI